MGRHVKAMAIAVSAIAAMAITTSCSSASSSSAAASGGSTASTASGSAISASSLAGKVIGYVPPVSIPAFVDMKNAMTTAAKKYDMTVVQAGGGQFDVTAQIQALDSLIARHVAVIVCPPLSPAAIEPVLKRAEAAGIKWIDYDSTIANPTLSIQSGEVASAAAVATKLAQLIKAAGKPCRVGIINGAPTVTALVYTAQGYKQGALAAGCTILASQTDTTNQPTGGQAIGTAWRSRFGSQMTGVLSYVGAVTQGVLATVGGSFHPLIGSEASSAAYQQDIAEGKIAVGFDSATAQIGQAAVWAAAELLSGKTLPSSVVSPAIIVDQSDVNQLEEPPSVTIDQPIGVSLTTAGGKPAFKFSYSS